MSPPSFMLCDVCCGSKAQREALLVCPGQVPWAGLAVAPSLLPLPESRPGLAVGTYAQGNALGRGISLFAGQLHCTYSVLVKVRNFAFLPVPWHPWLPHRAIGLPSDVCDSACGRAGCQLNTGSHPCCPVGVRTSLTRVARQLWSSEHTQVLVSSEVGVDTWPAVVKGSSGCRSRSL